MMIRLAALLAALLAPNLACTKQQKPPPQLDERHSFTADGASIRYNGRELRWDVPARQWQEALGPRSRKDDRISTWDDLGVFVYENLYDDTPDSLEVLFGRVPHSAITTTTPSFWPRELFRGRLVVDGVLIYKDSIMLEINRDKNGTEFRRGYLNTIYSYDLDGYYIRLDFGHDKSLTSFSMSKPIKEKAPGGVRTRGEQEQAP